MTYHAQSLATLFVALAAACGSGPDDEQLTIKVQSRLNGAPQTSTVEAQSKHDVVTLMGTVSSEATRKRAEEIARQVAGVKDVQNRIAVHVTATPK